MGDSGKILNLGGSNGEDDDITTNQGNGCRQTSKQASIEAELPITVMDQLVAGLRENLRRPRSLQEPK